MSPIAITSLPLTISETKSPCSSMALIALIDEFQAKMSVLSSHQMKGLEQTSFYLDKSSKEFLEDLKNLFETQKNAQFSTQIIKSFEYAASFITIAIGAGLCSTGIAAIVGSIMITTGVFGCIHTTMELSNGYAEIAKLTQDKAQQEIIRQYLPAMVATSLAISASISGSYSAQIALNSTLETLKLFLPLLMTSIQATQGVSKRIFDMHKNQREAKKIDQESLSRVLETIILEQQETLFQNLSSENKLTKDAQVILKTLTSLLNVV
jgi:hypothetical protein